jgi:acyl carrier protein
LEAKIAEICQQILSIAPVGIDDSFFELGGDSLIALRFVAEMKEKLAVSVPVAGLYEHLTIRSLAAMLEQQDKLGTENGLDYKTGSAERMRRRKQYQQMERARRAVK